MSNHQGQAPGDEANSEAIREARRVLRQVQVHLNQISINHGAQCESVGFMEVYTHPRNTYPELNYTTPRKGTAWVSAKDIEQGLELLRQRDRTPRLVYIEGLFPPQFARTLRGVGLRMEQETPLLTCQLDQIAPRNQPLPGDVNIAQVTDPHGSALWWYVWRNAHYDVIAHTAAPAAIGIDLYHIAHGSQVDLVMYRSGFPVGVARLDICEGNHSAQITAVAVIKEARAPELIFALQAKALEISRQRGATLAFVCGDSDRELYRAQGFLDCGSVLSYSQQAHLPPQDTASDDTALRPLVTLR